MTSLGRGVAQFPSELVHQRQEGSFSGIASDELRHVFASDVSEVPQDVRYGLRCQQREFLTESLWNFGGYGLLSLPCRCARGRVASGCPPDCHRASGSRSCRRPPSRPSPLFDAQIIHVVCMHLPSLSPPTVHPVFARPIRTTPVDPHVARRCPPPPSRLCRRAGACCVTYQTTTTTTHCRRRPLRIRTILLRR